ncbi:MAG: SDR family oxidoreductase [Aquaticitalea sp.]
MSKNISIIGCGWLGLPLAKQLVAENCKVKGSTTSTEKIPLLESVGIDGFYVEVTQEAILGNIENCLSNCEILVLNIPPSLRKNPDGDFVKQISNLIPYIETSSIAHVIFVSSTSVFADAESIPVITEATTPNPTTESGQQLLEVEKMLQKNPNFDTTILRFGGLFGKDRHPAKYLSGKTGIKSPNAPVNLIHLDDCIGIIQSIIKNKVWNETFNASTTPHPSKQNYYIRVCKDLNLPIPEFEKKSFSIGKIIDSKKLVQLLNYEFKVKLNN